MGCVARALRDEQRDTKVRKELRQQLRLRMEAAGARGRD